MTAMDSQLGDLLHLRSEIEGIDRATREPATVTTESEADLIHVLLHPSAASKTMRERIAKACAVLGRRLHDSNSNRCLAVIETLATGRPLRIDTLYSIRCERLLIYANYFRLRTLGLLQSR